MRPQLLLFDMDVTLVDHFQAIYRCHCHAMRQLGLPEPTLAQVRAAVGGGLNVAIARLAGPENVATILPIYEDHWDATSLDDVELLPGARELITAVRSAGGRCAVLTNERGIASREVCDHFGLSPLLSANVGATDTPWLKPARELTEKVLWDLGATAAEAAYVGDSPYDVATARNAGLIFYGVTTGTHTAEELRAAGAVNVCASLDEVRQLAGY